MKGGAMSREVMAGFGEKVHMLRRRKRLSQIALAARIHASQSTICNIERGKMAGLSLDHLLALATTLNVTTDYLLGHVVTHEQGPGTAEVRPMLSTATATETPALWDGGSLVVPTISFD